MNQTMSSSSEWMHFYNQSFSGQPTHHLPPSPIFSAGGDRVVSDATVVTTAVAATTAANSSPLSPEGRVSKPARKRSRASRRTPTTLLNTDTANFRAMVQQFTGGPSAPFGSASQPAGEVSFGFGAGSRQSFMNPVMVPAGFQFQQHPHQQQQQLFNQHLQFGLSSNGSNTPAVDGFLQRLSAGGRPSNGNGGGVTAEGIMNVELHGVSSQMAARPSNGSNENRSDASFMFQ